MIYVLCALLAVVITALIINKLRMTRVWKGRMDDLKEEMRQREYQQEYERRKAEIVSLQSQINPHFLYNTLELIRSEAIIHQDSEAAEIAEALANYFRYNISKQRDVVTLAEELKNVDNYISIQKKRFGSRVAYEVIHLTDAAENMEALLPKLTLQPLVENSIYHGLEKKAKGGKVTVRITCTGKRLTIQVEDDGPGMDATTLEEVEKQLADSHYKSENHAKTRHGGIALGNINSRIRMIFGEEYGLTFAATREVGAEAEIVIPFVKEMIPE